MLFYQFHVPKTGGSSLKHYAAKHNLRWISREHLYWSEQKAPEKAVTITALRCPVKQTISLYSYWNNGGVFHNAKGDPSPDVETWQWWALNLSFSEWLRKDCEYVHGWGRQFQFKDGYYPCGMRPSSNIYSAFFGDELKGGKVVGNFNKAVKNLKSIDYVLDTSRLTKQFNNIAKKYNLPYFNIHSNTSPPFNISTEDIEYIKASRKEDIELCKMFGVKSKYW